jgi:3-hydroxyacyl-[acyl-carrier-protein] dehydratase
MHLEYFHLIDRIVDLNVDERTIAVEAQVPQHNTIFEGHFPGYPLMPGVFLAAVKEAKMRSFVNPGDLLKIDANVVHEGSGYAITQAKVRVDGQLRCNATITFGIVPFPNPDLRGYMDAMAKRIGFPQQAIGND